MGEGYLPWTGYAAGGTPLAASCRRTFLYFHVKLFESLFTTEHEQLCDWEISRVINRCLSPWKVSFSKSYTSMYNYLCNVAADRRRRRLKALSSGVVKRGICTQKPGKYLLEHPHWWIITLFQKVEILKSALTNFAQNLLETSCTCEVRL